MLDLAPYYLTAIASLLDRSHRQAASPPHSHSGADARRWTAQGREVQPWDVPTHFAAALRLESGALATLTVSFESRGRYDSCMTVHGNRGVLCRSPTRTSSTATWPCSRSRRMGGRSVRVARRAGDAAATACMRCSKQFGRSGRTVRRASSACTARDGDGGAPLSGRRSHDRCRFAIHV